MPQGSDLALYRAIVDGIREGGGYYDVAAAELRARHYGIQSVFNWRMPHVATAFATAPDWVWRALCGTLAASTIAAAAGWWARPARSLDGNAAAFAVAGAVLGAFLPDVYLFSELWAGLLIALSATAYRAGSRTPGVGLALAALAVRELAVVYWAICLGEALWGRRWREVGALLTGAALYAGAFMLHAQQVARIVRPDDLGYPSGWVQFGGVPFLLTTLQMNGWLLISPWWLAAGYLALVLYGIATFEAPDGARVQATLVAYLAAFLLVGKSFNTYWGFVVAPLAGLAFGQAVADLWRATRPRR